MLRVIGIAVAFLAMQIVVSVLIAAGYAIFNRALPHAILIEILTSIISNLAIIFVLWKIKYVDAKRFFLKNTSWLNLLLMVVMLMSASFSCSVLEEMLQIPDNMAEIFPLIMNNPLGIVALAIIAPIAEEVVFRGAILGHLLENTKWDYRLSILVSALVFGVIHLNPIQIVFATIIGLLLGWAYWRTRSLLPCILMHVANNSWAVVGNFIDSGNGETMQQEVGTAATLGIILGAAGVAALLFFFLRKRMPLEA